MSSEAEFKADGGSEPEELPDRFQPGDNLNWDSELVAVELTVEVPFWLLIPSGPIELTLEGCTIQATVINNGLQFLSGRQFMDSGQGTLFIGTMTEAQNRSAPLISMPDGALVRPTKTLITFETKAHSDALEALKSNKLSRQNTGDLYFRSLAVALIGFLNHLINSYRQVTMDPFAIEVNAWDVPTWFLNMEGRKLPISIFSYSTWDMYPTIGPFSKPTQRSPYHAASIKEVQDAVGAEEVPGLIQLLDGWSLFFRGRHAESIVSFVTAIETLLEAKLRDVLRGQGLLPDEVEKKLFATRTKFSTRLEEYCDLIGSRPPGPIIHALPHLNGLRLASELDRTRDIRHSIVHAGLRLEFNLTGPMQRSAETTTWLFDWLVGDGSINRRQKKSFTFFHGVRGKQFFSYGLSASGLIIQAPPPWSAMRVDFDEDEEVENNIISSFDPGDNPVWQFWKALGGRGEASDIETFTLLAFAKLRAYGPQDSPLERSLTLPHKDRFRFVRNGKTTLIFLIDRDGFLEDRDVEQLAATVGIRVRQGLEVEAAICIINDQRFLPFDQRNSASITDSSIEIAKAYGVSLEIISKRLLLDGLVRVLIVGIPPMSHRP